MLCREEAVDLCGVISRHVAAGNPQPSVFGVIKEYGATEAEDTKLGTSDFANKYFTCGELYLDEARAVYKEVLGNKKLSLPIGKMLFSPLTTWREIKAMGARTKEKGVEGNMAGEGLVKGGILIVGPGGTDVIYSYAEETGSEIPIKEIEEALGKLAKSVQKA